MTVRAIDGCIKCGACVRACPVLSSEGAESFPGPRRLAVEAPRYDRELERVGEALTLCTTCGRCEEACPSQLPLPESMVRLRTRAAVPPSAGQLRLRDNFDRTGRVVEPTDHEVWPSSGDLAFFPGCISEGRLPSAVVSSLRLLQAAGATPFVPAGWACCGSPLQKIGDDERLERARDVNARSLERIETVVASCPGCTAQLQKDHGKEALHIIEHLHAHGHLSSSSFDPGAPPVRVALHRPCHLARVIGPHTMDMAKDLLSLVPGVTVVEHDGEDECCGGGGGVASARPEVALRMATRKVIAARKAGADLLLAPCPFCVINLRKVGSLEVEEFATFLAGRLAKGNIHK